MMDVLSVINQKGGVAKTTTAGAIGAGLALRGFRVLFINLNDLINTYLDERLEQEVEALKRFDEVFGEN
jgi:chromosome partitioning protein